ncbi:MAG: hypothetical protein ACXU9Z_07630 [Gemmatimonadaceae bacterium]
MPRRLSPEKQLELDRLARVLGVIAAYFDSLTGLPPDGETLAKAIAAAHHTGDLRGLRMAQGDLVGLIQAATSVQRRALDRVLREQTGTSLGSLLERQFEQVRRLLQRGKLTSEQQYYLVREHVELIADDPEHATALPELYALLDQYEVTAAALPKRRHRDQAV